MNKTQLQEILDYLDAEFAGIVNKMSDLDRKKRAVHWAKEIGSYDYQTVLDIVKKLSQNSFMPRTAEVISEINRSQNFSKNKNEKSKCKIISDFLGNEIVTVFYSNGEEMLTGYLKNLPEWMQLKFRWMANPTEENAIAWDNYLIEHGG